MAREPFPTAFWVVLFSDIWAFHWGSCSSYRHSSQGPELRGGTYRITPCCGVNPCTPTAPTHQPMLLMSNWGYSEKEGWRAQNKTSSFLGRFIGDVSASSSKPVLTAFAHSTPCPASELLGYCLASSLRSPVPPWSSSPGFNPDAQWRCQALRVEALPPSVLTRGLQKLKCTLNRERWSASTPWGKVPLVP